MRCVDRFGVGLLALCVLALCPGCDRGEKKVVLPPPQVTVQRPVLRQVTDCLEFTGTTQAFETVDIRARVKGFLDKVLYEPRATVKKNDVLFVIDPREYQAALERAKANVAARKADLEFAEFDYDRLADLAKHDAAAEVERVQAQAKRDSARAAVASAEAQLAEAKLNLSYTEVATPIEGRVGRNQVDAGNLVGGAENTLLATVVDDDPIYAYFSVSERDLLALIRRYLHAAASQGITSKPASTVIPAYLALSDESDYPHQGRVDYWDTRVDPETGTLSVRAVFPNSTGLILPGVFVRVRVPVNHAEAILVPEVALSADPGGRFVLVVDDNNTVRYRPVKIGTAADDGTRVILSGLGQDDWVIVSGLQSVRPGATVNPQRQAPAAATRPQDSK